VSVRASVRACVRACVREQGVCLRAWAGACVHAWAGRWVRVCVRACKRARVHGCAHAWVIRRVAAWPRAWVIALRWCVRAFMYSCGKAGKVGRGSPAPDGAAALAVPGGAATAAILAAGSLPGPACRGIAPGCSG